jgi:hypothetical protein
MFRLATSLTLIIILSIGNARADGNTDFHAAVSEAYGGYRAATSYLRTGNPGLASLEIAAAQDSWRLVIDTYASAPPSAFAGDPQFSTVLNDVASRLDSALGAAENGDAATARKALEPIRGDLYDLRKRNGVRVYADCVTELNSAMEPLFVHRHDTPDVGDAGVRAQVTAESEIYAALLADCRSMAPDSYTGDPEFVRLFDGTRDSIQSMFPAIDSGDAGRVINVLRELRSFDRIIYFRFGG